MKDEGDPVATGINSAKKYVVSRRSRKLDWKESVLLKGNVVNQIRRLKEQEGPDLQVHGSGDFIQTLLRHDLVDEFWLKIFPVALGRGKRLFAAGSIPAAFRLIESKVSPSGVLIASYKREGDVKTGSFVPESPSEAELARRKRPKKGG
jgi:dihydrofolate reductase